MSQANHRFEMTDVLDATMNIVANAAREYGEAALDEKQYEVKHAVREVINAYVSDREDAQRLYDRFCTGYENACEAAREGTFSIEVADDEAIYADHDGKMESGTHFHGHVTKEVRSPQTNKYGRVEDENLYLIYRLEETGHEICNCPSMMYNFWCKHSIANELLRNLPEEPTALVA